MSGLLYYPICLLLNGCELFLLWGSGDKGRDFFVLSKQNPLKLLTTRTEAEVLDYAKEHNLPLSKEPLAVFDFDELDTVLARLRPDRTLSIRVANIILNIWNILDDVSYSIGRQLIPVDSSSKKGVDLLYEKMFYGTNLLTPPGEKYSPLLTTEERATIRKLLRNAKKELVALTE